MENLLLGAKSFYLRPAFEANVVGIIKSPDVQRVVRIRYGTLSVNAYSRNLCYRKKGFYKCGFVDYLWVIGVEKVIQMTYGTVIHYGQAGI